jgi:hypothetical protein
MAILGKYYLNSKIPMGWLYFTIIISIVLVGCSKSENAGTRVGTETTVTHLVELQVQNTNGEPSGPVQGALLTKGNVPHRIWEAFADVVDSLHSYEDSATGSRESTISGDGLVQLELEQDVEYLLELYNGDSSEAVVLEVNENTNFKSIAMAPTGTVRFFVSFRPKPRHKIWAGFANSARVLELKPDSIMTMPFVPAGDRRVVLYETQLDSLGNISIGQAIIDSVLVQHSDSIPKIHKTQQEIHFNPI